MAKSAADSTVAARSNLATEIRALLPYAILAPSVHNIQPWEFRVFGPQLTITPSPQRRLRSGDAAGRQSWISLGACVANVEIAANHFGLGCTMDRDSLGASDHPAAISLAFTRSRQARPAAPPSGSSNEPLFQAIPQRFSDRSIYRAQAVPAKVMTRLAACSQGTAEVATTASRAHIATIARLTQQGIAAAFSNPGFRSELADLIAPSEGRSTGFTPQALQLGRLRGRMEPMLVRYGLHRRSQAALEGRRMASAAAIIAILSEGDTPLHWVDAGRAYQRALLTATAGGLRSTTSAAVVEAFDFHTEIEQLFSTSKRLQVVARIGYSDTPPYHSPRLPLEQVMAH